MDLPAKFGDPSLLGSGKFGDPNLLGSGKDKN